MTIEIRNTLVWLGVIYVIGAITFSLFLSIRVFYTAPDSKRVSALDERISLIEQRSVSPVADSLRMQVDSLRGRIDRLNFAIEQIESRVPR